MKLGTSLLSALALLSIPCALSETMEAAEQSNQAGLAILRELHAKGERNVAVSPISINSVFSVLQRGAAGNTLTQIKQTLGDTTALRQIVSSLSASSPGLVAANSLVVDKDFKLLPSFIAETPKEEIRIADFKANPDKELRDINAWVEKNTKGDIKDFLKPGAIDSRTAMVALNALVFEGNWAHPFDEKHNMEYEFSDGAKSPRTTFMFQTAPFPMVVTEDRLTMVSMPYTSMGGEGAAPLSFVIIMPGEEATLEQSLPALSWEKIQALLEQRSEHPRDIRLGLPKFELKTPLFRLSEPLKKLGMTDIFDPAKANFSLMTAAKNIFLDEVYHQCRIKVDEKGTKASAATAGIIAKTSLPPLIQINRPFLWLIHDPASGLILFCGTFDTPDVSEAARP